MDHLNMAQPNKQVDCVYINNERLDIAYELDIEESNSLWQVDRLRAINSDDGKEVAYLKTAFIPKERFERLCPEGLIGWLSRRKGYPVFDRYNADRQSFSELGDEELYNSVKNLFWYTNYQTIESRGSVTRADLLNKVNTIKPFLVKKYGFYYEEFCNYHIDKPEIAYVRLTDESYRGAGTALYGAGAIWMMQRGYVLHASGLQTEEAKSAWQRMVSYGWVSEESTEEKLRRVNRTPRMTLDAERVVSSDHWETFSASFARKAKLKI